MIAHSHLLLLPSQVSEIPRKLRRSHCCSRSKVTCSIYESYKLYCDAWFIVM